ncbi:MAG: hypothetical protein WBB85_16765 [Albidovulum sp.]|uniref:hypothetical protein n=1 Tax=Albidovulum sp. TaxID=1872424 RepID=UPI003CBD928B
MKRPTHRGHKLIALGAAAAVVIAGSVAARSADMQGRVRFEGGAAIPAGHIAIYVEMVSSTDAGLHQTEQARLESNGKSQAMDFSFPLPAGSDASAPRRIIARLEREDGWLLARGSAVFDPDAVVNITLNAALY